MSHASLLVALDPTDDVEAAVAEQMAPFSENDSWFADGSRWDWYIIGGRCDGILANGNVVQRKGLDLANIGARNAARLTRQWQRAQQEAPNLRDLLHDVAADETLEAFLNRKHADFPAHYAFLRNRNWHEHERMGWWGGTAATECELAGNETHICTHEKDGARIISWGGSASWHKMFYPRFVEPLPPETLLVTVDYHV